MDNFEQLKKENELLRKELVSVTKLVDKLTDVLNLCRQQMLPLDVAKAVDKILEYVENY